MTRATVLQSLSASSASTRSASGDPAGSSGAVWWSQTSRAFSDGPTSAELSAGTKRMVDGDGPNRKTRSDVSASGVSTFPDAAFVSAIGRM